MSEDSDHEPALNRRIDDATDRLPDLASIQRYRAGIRFGLRSDATIVAAKLVNKDYETV